jgi:hypothetical protein
MSTPARQIRVVIESPLGSRPDGSRISPASAEFASNVHYARQCVADSLRRGEAPFASHVLYPLVLDDATPEERKQGMSAGFEWLDVAELQAVYVDRGVTPGMRDGMDRGRSSVHGAVPLVFRKLGDPANYLDPECQWPVSLSAPESVPLPSPRDALERAATWPADKVHA